VVPCFVASHGCCRPLVISPNRFQFSVAVCAVCPLHAKVRCGFEVSLSVALCHRCSHIFSSQCERDQEEEGKFKSSNVTNHTPLLLPVAKR
jgi:hypothetical protein